MQTTQDLAHEHQKLAFDEEQAHLSICRDRIAKSSDTGLLPFDAVMKSVFGKQ